MASKMLHTDWNRRKLLVNGVYAVAARCSFNLASYLRTVDGTVGCKFFPPMLKTSGILQIVLLEMLTKGFVPDPVWIENIT